MWRLIISLALVLTCATHASGQGKVAFGNDSNHLFVSVTGGTDVALPVSPLPNGISLMAVLYAGTSSGNLWLQTSIVLDSTGMFTDGRMVTKYVLLAGVPGAVTAYFQIFIMNTGAVLPASIVGGYNYGTFVGATYFGTSGLFTATPGASLSYPSLVSGGPSASTWAPGPLVVNGCLSCVPPFFEVQPSNTSVVAGNTTSIWAYARSYQGLQVAYQWWKDGSQIAGATNSGLALRDTIYSDGGVYCVVASDIYGGRQSQSATLMVFAPIIASTLGSPSYTTDGRFQFTVTGTPGTNYIVQVSTNLSAITDWVSLLTNASPFTFVDTNANSFPQRFYRAYAP